MNNYVSINKLLAISALMCSILSAVMSSGELNPIYLIMFFVTVIVGLSMEFKYLPALSRKIINLCALALLVIILSQLRSNNIIEPFMKVILAMTAVKMLENKTARDYMQMLLLSLMMLICYAMVSVDKSFILFCFGEGIICSFVMVLSAWLTKDPNAEISYSNLMQLFSRLLFMFILMIPLCLIMFIIAPRVRSPFFGVHGSQGISQVGFTDQVRLGGVSEVQKNNKLAFRAEMDRQAFTPYWRGVVLDSFDGRTWISLPNQTRQRQASGKRNPVKQKIYLEPGRRRYLFALDIPVSVLNVNAEVLGSGVIVYRGRNDGRRLQYTAFSTPSSVIPMERESFRRRRYMELPPNYIPKLENEVEKLTEGLDNPGKVAAILSYLSPPNFVYSLTEMSDGSNALENFIFENKKGNCEFFASAMGVMLRMAGIPSRLVGGFKGGIYNDAGGYYAVFEEFAHVWVELWDEERASWIRYDPTPYSPEDDWNMDDYGFFEAYFDLLDYQWTKFVLNYNLEIQGEVIQSVKDIISNPNSSDFDGFIEYIPIVSGVVVFLILCIYVVRGITTEDKSRVLINIFTRIMKRKGYSKHKSEGLREFSSRLPVHEKIKAMPFIERFEEYYYKEKEFDEKTVRILTENLKTLRKN